MFGREIRLKLLEMRFSLSNVEEIRERDVEKKLVGKDYAENKRGIFKIEVKVGDIVLLRNIKEIGKLALNFETKSYTVVEKEGSEVTVERDGVEYRRNFLFVKSFIESTKV